MGRRFEPVWAHLTIQVWSNSSLRAMVCNEVQLEIYLGPLRLKIRGALTGELLSLM